MIFRFLFIVSAWMLPGIYSNCQNCQKNSVYKIKRQMRCRVCDSLYGGKSLLNHYGLGLLLIQRSPARCAVHWGATYLQDALREREGTAGWTGNHLVASECGRVSGQQQQQPGGLLHWDHKVDNQQHTHDHRAGVPVMTMVHCQFSTSKRACVMA